MPVQSAKRKKTFEERADAVRTKNESKLLGVPARLATPEVRRARLIEIQKLMDLSHEKYRAMLGLSEQHWRSVREGKKPIVLGIVFLAEIELGRFKARQAREKPVLEDIPDVYKNDVDLQRTVIMDSLVSGLDENAIAAKHAVRLEIVRYYLSKIA